MFFCFWFFCWWVWVHSFSAHFVHALRSGKPEAENEPQHLGRGDIDAFDYVSVGTGAACIRNQAGIKQRNITSRAERKKQKGRTWGEEIFDIMLLASFSLLWKHNSFRNSKAKIIIHFLILYACIHILAVLLRIVYVYTYGIFLSSYRYAIFAHYIPLDGSFGSSFFSLGVRLSLSLSLFHS